MLFLLKNQRGEAILMAQAATKSEADEFGRTHVPEFCGESLEIEPHSRTEAEEFWRVRTVCVSGYREKKGGLAVQTRQRRAPKFTMTHVWIHGLELPPDVVEDDLLTAEDQRDLALDHIARTSDYVGHVEILKWACR